MSAGAVFNLEPTTADFRGEVLHGLSLDQKRLPCKYFYDAHGSWLFDRICELDEYYLTRTELSILERHASEMAALAGERCLLIELGSGSSIKTRLLLDDLARPVMYMPVDIAREHLASAAERIAEAYPSVRVLPLCKDFTSDFSLPPIVERVSAKRRLVFFPGSTIGNFEPKDAGRLLAGIASLCGRDGALLIGIDLKKSRNILEAAYNDAAGVTRDFNLNLLQRINAELDADFDLDGFEHRALYNEKMSRVEMHIVSRCDQRVRIGEADFEFAKGETIWTESSHKYSIAEFAGLANGAGFRLEASWQDDEQKFAILYLRVVT